MDILNDLNQTALIVESAENKNGVLATLTGPFMEIDNPKGNRNIRLYSRDLIKNRILESPFTKELIKAKMLLGETKHPEDRFDVDIEKASHNTTQLWIDEEQNLLMGKMDILDTPCGRIVKSLLDYGSNIGVSARARGSVKKVKGLDVVDEDTYIFKTFDLVPLPGFAKSRLTIVNEGIDEDVLLESIKENVELTPNTQLSRVRDILESVSEEYFQDVIKSIDNKLKSTSDNSEQPLVERLKELESENIALVEKVANLEIDMDFMEDKIRDKVQLEMMEELKDKELELKEALNEVSALKDNVRLLKNTLNESQSAEKVTLKPIAESAIKYSEEIVSLKESLDNVTESLSATEEANKILLESIKVVNEEKELLNEEKDLLNEELDNYSCLLESSKEAILEMYVSQNYSESLVRNLLESNKFTDIINLKESRETSDDIEIISVVNENVMSNNPKVDANLVKLVSRVRGGK